MENENIDKKVALVTGGGRGIGRAICLELAGCGYYVIVNYRSNEKEASQTLTAIKQSGGNGETLQFDVSSTEASRNAVEDIVSRLKAVHVLINNAGVNADQLFVMMKPELWRKVIETNLNGFYNVTRPVLEYMIPNKQGAVVSISSAAGIMGNRGQSNYSASKAGLIGASRVVAAEVARLGIRVNVLAPGLIETEMLDQAPLNQIKSMIPMARVGKAEEVAKVVRFLCSDDAAYITGQTISVNGGML